MSHVVPVRAPRFESEAIDRMYLNGYVPSLQSGAGVVYFMKQHLGARVPSTMMVAPPSERFVRAIGCFVETEGLDLVTFKKGQRKDDVAQEYLASFTGEEGVLFVGKAQEKASVFRPQKRRRPDGSTSPWIYRSTPPAASLSGWPPGGGLPLSALHPPTRIRLDPGPGSAAHRPQLL